MILRTRGRTVQAVMWRRCWRCSAIGPGDASRIFTNCCATVVCFGCGEGKEGRAALRSHPYAGCSAFGLTGNSRRADADPEL